MARGEVHVTIQEGSPSRLERARVSGAFMWHIKAPSYAEAARLLLEWIEKEDE